MSEKGVGLKLLVLSCCVWAGGTWACDTADRDTVVGAENGEAAQKRVQVGDPEQVVQRIVAAPDPSASDRSATNGVRPAADTADTAVASPKSSGEPITPKHLEAELNRLEAELGR